jgi:hypothetical protein
MSPLQGATDSTTCSQRKSRAPDLHAYNNESVASLNLESSSTPHSSSLDTGVQKQLCGQEGA